MLQNQQQQATRPVNQPVSQPAVARFDSWLRLKLIQIVWLATGLVEALIGLRFVLKLIAANPNNVFASFIYRVTRILMIPFADLTITPSAGGVVLEINALI